MDNIGKWALGYKEAGDNENGLLGFTWEISDADVVNDHILEKTPVKTEIMWCKNTSGVALVPGTVVRLRAADELIYSVEACPVGGIPFGIVDPELRTNVAAGEKFNVIRKGVTLGRANGTLAKGAAVTVGATSELAVGGGDSFGYMLEAATADQLRRVYVDFTNIGIESASGVSHTVRVRLTAAQVNAGHTVLPALPGLSYRLHDAALIAVGANAGGATGVLVRGTQGASAVSLMDAKVAGLTRSTLLRAGTATNGLILADGASFVANDVNTAITVIKDGSDLTGATHIDVLLTYEVV